MAEILEFKKPELKAPAPETPERELTLEQRYYEVIKGLNALTSAMKGSDPDVNPEEQQILEDTEESMNILTKGFNDHLQRPNVIVGQEEEGPSAGETYTQLFKKQLDVAAEFLKERTSKKQEPTE